MSPAPPVEAISIAATLALMALAIFFARLVRRTGPSQVRRILLPAGFFVLGSMLVIWLPVFIATPSLALLTSLAFGMVWIGLPALLSAAALDGVATLVGAERTPQWLAAGIVAAIIVTYIWLAVLAPGLLRDLGLLAVFPGLLAAASAITWWPYLPRPEDDPEEEEVSGLFE